MSDSDPIVVLAAYPYIPAELGIPHLGSTYLPADIHSRFLRVFGKESVYISATDVQGFQSKQVVKEYGEEVVQQYHEEYRELFERYHIDFDVYGRTDNSRIEAETKRAYQNLDDAGLIFEDTVEVYRCNDCGECLPKRFRTAEEGLRDIDFEDIDSLTAERMQCGICRCKEIEAIEKDHLFLDIEASDHYDESVDDQYWSDVTRQLQTELQDVESWDIVRDGHFGVDVPGREGTDFYVWFSSLVADATLLPPELFDELKSGATFEWHEFIGKNITYYQGIVSPVILRDGLGLDEQNVQLASRGHMDIDDDTDLTVDSVPTEYDVDYFRFYLGNRVTDSMTDFSLTAEEFTDFVNNTVVGTIGSLFTRCLTILENEAVEVVPDSDVEPERLTEQVAAVEDAVAEMRVQQAVNETQAYFNVAHSVVDDEELWDDPDDDDIALLCRILAYGLTLLAPIMPEKVENFDVFEGWERSTVADVADIGGTSLSFEYERWEYI